MNLKCTNYLLVVDLEFWGAWVLSRDFHLNVQVLLIGEGCQKGKMSPKECELDVMGPFGYFVSPTTGLSISYWCHT